MDMRVLVPLLILLAIIVVSSVMYVLYAYIKQNTLESIRLDVYKLFLKAESKYKHGDNDAKFNYVIKLARSMLPSWTHIFITEKVLASIIEYWFRGVKDLLDDGKMNKSNGRE